MVTVALLRGVNVGGNHKLPMRDFKALLEGLGCASVRTYIQSGNAVFEAAPALVAGLPAAFEAALKKKAGFEAPLVLRSGLEWAALSKRNPFLREGVSPEHCIVAFLSGKPSAGALKTLDPGRSPGDRFAVVGREIYLHLPQGFTRTKFTNAYFDSALKSVCTFRNWRTVQALQALARPEAS